MCPDQQKAQYTYPATDSAIETMKTTMHFKAGGLAPPEKMPFSNVQASIAKYDKARQDKAMYPALPGNMPAASAPARKEMLKKTNGRLFKRNLDLMDFKPINYHIIALYTIIWHNSQGYCMRQIPMLSCSIPRLQLMIHQQ